MDSADRFVGSFVPAEWQGSEDTAASPPVTSWFLRRIAGITFRFPWDNSSLLGWGTATIVKFVYKTADCAAPAYLISDRPTHGFEFVGRGSAAGSHEKRSVVLAAQNILYYPGDPIISSSYVGTRALYGDGTLGGCYTGEPSSGALSLGEVTTFDMGTLGLETPFRIQ